MSRNELLSDLADAVNEMTEPRMHTEYLEASVTEQVAANGGRRKKAKRTRQRRKHVVMLPSLLENLRSAAVPGSGEAAGVTGGFESRPSAELEPLSVLREITDDVGVWSRTFSIERATLAATMHGLISAPSSDEQLEKLVRQAKRWVKRARLATGFDPAPMTLNQACPYCNRKHALVITGDLQNARCSNCGVEWSPDLIGLLAEMLRVNETQETMVLAACWMPDCTAFGPHDVHHDQRGRTWRDSCEVSDPDGRISA